MSETQIEKNYVFNPFLFWLSIIL